MQNKKIWKLGKPRLLIVGCGDVGMRLLPLLRDRYRIFALTSNPDRREALRAAGAVPVLGDLDRRDSLRRLTGLTDLILHLAPPQQDGMEDERTRNLITILPERAALVYVSTTGVYGDCQGAHIDETRPTNPKNARARRRVSAESQLRDWARRSGSRLAILRVPGIYAADRLPIERLQKGTPALKPDEDVFTNHIHADDLARVICSALYRGLPGRVYNIVDDSDMRMADYFDAVADAFGMARPPRMGRTELSAAVSPMLLSFMSESRRIGNRRMKSELGVRLLYPTVHALLGKIEEGEET